MRLNMTNDTCNERAVARSAGSRILIWSDLGLTPQALRCHPLPRVKNVATAG
jgi:hypothetical protein